MIVNKEYRISWKHYNKDLDIELTKDELKEEILTIMNTCGRVEAINKVDTLLTTTGYNKSFSECIIEKLCKEDKQGGPCNFWEIFSKGIAIVHPNDNFNRKKGVFVSFDDAVANIENRCTRKLLWDAFWKEREAKRENIILQPERDRHLRVFLEETSKKRIQGKHIIYTIPENTEIWFPRND